MRAKLTGENVDDVMITKSLNVQQNPGRGAKVVAPRSRPVNYKHHRPVNIDGSRSRSVIRLSTKFALGQDFVIL